MKKKILTTIGLTIAILILSGLAVHAYEIDPNYKPINEPFANQEFSGRASSATIVILQILAGGLLYLAIPVAVIMLAQGGFNFVTGGADQEKLDAAKKHITWSILGLFLIILSYSIVRLLIGAAIRSAETGS